MSFRMKIVTAILCVFVFICRFTSSAQDYVKMEKLAAEKLQAALEAGDVDAARTYGNIVEQVSKARYLSNTSEVNENLVRPLIEGFKPQIATLPQIAKAVFANGLRDETGNHAASAQAAAQWLLTTNVEASKIAAGEVAVAFDKEREQANTELENAKKTGKVFKSNVTNDEWMMKADGKWKNLTAGYEQSATPPGLPVAGSYQPGK